MKRKARLMSGCMKRKSRWMPDCMKLKVKLLLICMLVFTVAFSACTGLILSESINSVLNVVRDYTTTQQRLLVTHFASEMESVSLIQSDLAQRSRAVYVFDELSRNIGEESSYILLQGEDVLQNNSGINLRPFAYDVNAIDDSQECYRQYIGGSWYCIAQSCCSVGQAVYTIGVVRDITDDMTALTYRTLWSACICIIALILSLVVITMFVEKALRPIQHLQQGANAIAAGDYNRRIQLQSNDEIGQLALCFNGMAQSVQDHITQVESVSEERKLLLRALAHEMRTPITAISGYAHALHYAKLSEADEKEAADFIHSESLRLERLSTKLTELITLEDFQIKPKPIDVKEFAKNLTQTLEPIAQNAGVRLDITAKGTLSGDEDLLTSVLTNLFDNARKAGSKHIWIKIDSNALCVSDDGRGIPLSEIEKITQPFYQMDSSRHEGFGLGLSLCSRIAQLHGGELQIMSTPGTGTKITFSLQFHDDSQMNEEV